MRSRRHPPPATTRRPAPCWSPTSCRSTAQRVDAGARDRTRRRRSALRICGVLSASPPTEVHASTATRRARVWRSSRETPMLAGLELGDPRESFLGAHALGALAVQLRGRRESRPETVARTLERPSRARSKRLPSWFAQLGQFTHVDGLLFVARVRARHPWSAVDALWSDPPASSRAGPSPGEVRRLRGDDRRRRERCFRRCRASGARPPATCSASWWCAPGSKPRSRRRSPRGPPPAGAAIAPGLYAPTPSASARRRGRLGAARAARLVDGLGRRRRGG